LPARCAALGTAADYYLARGVTWVQDAWVEPSEVPVYLSALRAGALSVAINLAFRADPVHWRSQVPLFSGLRAEVTAAGSAAAGSAAAGSAAAGSAAGSAAGGPGVLTARTVKFFVDGVILGAGFAQQIARELDGDRPLRRYGLVRVAPGERPFAGLLIDGAPGWDADLQAIGTEGDFAFLAFPQGSGRVRVYGGYALEQRKRFSGDGGAGLFLDAFRMNSAPANEHLAAATPAGPLFSYFNNDSWTDEPFAPGVVLIGDAAGWNDPIIGLGLSITYRDVRIVSDILKSSGDWSPAAFAPYAQERAERMRRLRFSASLQAALDMEFSEAARERRRRYHEASAADPSLGMHSFAVMAGPENLPPDVFTPAHRARVLGQ